MSSGMTRDEQPHPHLQQQTAVQPKQRSNRIAIALLLTGLGGFMGGMLTSYGPTYLNIHLAEPVLAPHRAATTSPVAPMQQVALPSIHEPAPVVEASVPAAAEGRLVIHSHDRAYLVLQTSAPKAWGKSTIRKRVDKDGFLSTLSQDVRVSSVPAELLAYRDREFVLHDAGGYVCTATAGPLKLLQQRASDYEPDATGPQEWDEYANEPLLVSELAATSGRCKDALWARDASLVPAAIGRVSAATGAGKREARAAFRATAEYKTLQAGFVAEGGTGRWDASDRGTSTITSINSAREELVFIGTQAGGCGDFEAQVGMVFRRDARGELERVPSEQGLMLAVDAAADLDGDGDLELITTGDGLDRSLMHQSEGFVEDTRSAISIYFCRC